MTSNTYTPNPLRPYYIPPAHDFLTGKLGTTAGNGATTSSAAAAVTSSSGGGAFSSATREMLSDLDYSYLETPGVGETVRNVIDAALMRYTSVLILQPFKVAKTVLQVQHIPKRKGRTLGAEPGSAAAGDEDTPGVAEFGAEWKQSDDNASDDDDDPPYFASNDLDSAAEWSQAPRQSSAKRSEREPSRGRRMVDRKGNLVHDPEVTGSSAGSTSSYIKTAKVGVLGDVLNGIWNKEGAWGVWKGANAAFIYVVATSTLESWTQSFLSAALSIPDPSLTDIADTPYPLVSLSVSVATSAAIALLLAPLDIIRTRLMIAPIDDRPRGFIPLLQSMPSMVCPNSLLLPTALHAALPSFMSLGTPYFLRTQLGIDSVLTPASYSIGTFMSSVFELFLRLPLETVLRRGQLETSMPSKTIVPVGKYTGVVGTLGSIYNDEDSGGKLGIEGLFRGWRLGMWGLVGVRLMGLLGGSPVAVSSAGAAPF